MECEVGDVSCDVGIPSYQPTFDLSRKRVLANNNIITVRELVKAKQEERRMPVGNIFVQRMEDTLMRWKPPVSSHQGTTMAVDGNHPFQLPTAKMQARAKEEPCTLQDSVAAYRSINNWWRHRSKVSVGEAVGDEEDNFSFDFGNNDFDTTVDLSDTIVRTPYGVPVSLPETSREDRETILLNEQEIYRQYYRNPIPDDYLSMAHNGELCDHQAEKSWFIDGIRSCFPSCTT